MSVQVLHLRGAGGDQTERTVRVYRPAVPDSSKLPVLYFLHGLPGSSSDVAKAGIVKRLENSFEHGRRPFVLVVPDGNSKSYPDAEWADSRDGAEEIETWLTKTVIPAVEGSHRRPASKRAIAGFSMGGYGAMNLAMRHRNLFGAVVSIAGYFHVDDPNGVFGGDPATIDANSPDLDIGRARGLRIMLLDASDDTQQVTAGESQRFDAELNDAGIPATFAVAPGTHNWAYVAKQTPVFERFLEAGWR